MVSRAQILVVFGATVAVIASILVFNWGGALPRAWLPPVDSPISRIAGALRWLAVPGGCLLLAIGMVAARRFFTRAGIEGGVAPAGSALEIDLRVVTNTAEQVLLAAIGYLAFAVTAPLEQLGLIPAAAMAFAIGRVAFAVGYHVHPLARAFGFGLTFYPTVVIYVWLFGELVLPH